MIFYLLSAAAILILVGAFMASFLLLQGQLKGKLPGREVATNLVGGVICMFLSLGIFANLITLVVASQSHGAVINLEVSRMEMFSAHFVIFACWALLGIGLCFATLLYMQARTFAPEPAKVKALKISTPLFVVGIAMWACGGLFAFGQLFPIELSDRTDGTTVYRVEQLIQANALPPSQSEACRESR